MIDETEMILRGSLEEVVLKRDLALDLYRQAMQLMQRAQTAHAEAAHSSYAVNVQIEHDHLYHDKDFDYTMDKVRKHVDADVWGYLLEATKMRNLMDTEALEKFRRQLEKPPEVTIENVRSTLAGLGLQRHEIFRRGIVNVFRGLCHDYKSNSAFKVGRRIVLEYAVERHWLNKRSQIEDVDRIFHVLDKKPAPTYDLGLAGVIGAAKSDAWTCETEYFFARWFKNRNLHIYVKRFDLLDQVNRLIAEEFGAALGAVA